MKNFIALFVAVMAFTGCGETSEAEMPVHQAAQQETDEGARTGCGTANRIEIDVRDEDPEYDLPNNYKLELKQGTTIVGRKSFSQYCTLNNTFAKPNLPAGTYTYRITSTCTGRVYEGTINYTGGYYATAVYISQSYCK